MSRFYVPPTFIHASRIRVPKDESHHIIDVMRLGKGDIVSVFDGTGKFYEGKIVSTRHNEVIIDIEHESTQLPQPKVQISLAQAIPKKEKMEYIIEKVTELGIQKIIPFVSTRTVVRLREGRSEHRIERWRKIAVSSSKQSGRSTLPELCNIADFEKVMEYTRQYDSVIMPCLSLKSTSLYSALRRPVKWKRVLVITGPEGGFTDEEVNLASEHAVLLVSLGNLVLKSDTAAISTVSILHYRLNLQ